MKTIYVKISRSSYPIVIGAGLGKAGVLIRRISAARRALIVTHASLWKRYGNTLKRSLEKSGIAASLFTIPEGERAKTLGTVEKIYHSCLKADLDRRSLILALGGGVVGDVAGFAAATYMRGIPLVMIPTTLLAMVDSAIGGKVGVDLKKAKNYVGSFYQPKLVIEDVSVLGTLPKREFRNGMAEVIKYGVISDGSLFRTLETEISGLGNSVSETLPRVIAACAKIKADVISKDELETKGLREILNFGHTWGHAIETYTQYKSYKHGEAVSIGMCAAGSMALKIGLWKRQDLTRLEDLLGRAGLPLKLERPLSPKTMLEILARDKKNRRGNLRFVLPVKIGKVIVRKVSPELALEGLNYVQA